MTERHPQKHDWGSRIGRFQYCLTKRGFLGTPTEYCPDEVARREVTMHRVRIVDDDRCHRETFGAALRLEGYAVLEADTAGCAIDSLAAHSPDAMFLDLRLPDKTGIDVLKWMRSVNRFVPTAVMTAFRGEFDPDEAIALGALAYAEQPLSLEALLATARALVRPSCASSDPDDLHRRVMAGDPAALDRLVHICLRQLPGRLQSAFPRESWDLSVDAVSDACLFYATGGARRVPDGASVLNFLFKIAWRRLSDAHRSAAARATRERRWASEQPTTTNPADVAQAFDVWGLIVSVTKDLRERRAAELWLDRAPTDAIATALGAGHLPPADRGRTAKQFKDRLIKRLSRRLS